MELTMDVIRQCAQTTIQNKPFVIDALECEAQNTAEDLSSVDSIVSDLLRSEDAIYHASDDTKSALGPDIVVELNRLLTPLDVSRSKLALMLGEDNAIVNAGHDLSKKQREAWSERLASGSVWAKENAASTLRQRFIAATKEDSCEVGAHRPIFFHDLIRLCDVIEPAPCSSAEAIAKVCATFAGTLFGIDPSTRTLLQCNWSAIGRELKKHLGYEPTVYSDRIELRDGFVWYDFNSHRITFSMH